jgi:branched-chain amino acid transport system ATP-binding protein
MLKISDLSVYHGHVHALKGISLRVDEGEIVSLIGANGAGKSTALSAISGVVRPARGRIEFRGRDITNSRPQEIVRSGLVQAPEGRAILATLTVRENLDLGAFTRKDRPQVRKDLDSVLSRFPVLLKKSDDRAGTLSGGEQQMLAIGRALMARPKMLLLDEPSMGLAPLLVREIFDVIQEINGQGTSILLVEQNARAALAISGRGYVLENGRVVLEAAAGALLHDPMVIRAYLGARGRRRSEDGKLGR